jgi:hypothetical protein
MRVQFKVQRYVFNNKKKKKSAFFAEIFPPCQKKLKTISYLSLFAAVTED